MGDIFISYAHLDTERFVHEFANRLMRYGYSVWWDTVSIRGGKKWEVEIRSGIEDCTYFLPVVSEASAKSVWVGKEIQLARKHNKTIIPIIIDGGDIDDMPGNIADDQGVKFTSDMPYDPQFDKMRGYLTGIEAKKKVLTYADLPDLLRDSNGVKIGGLEKDWIVTRDYGSRPDDPVALLIGDTPFRANAHIVAPRSASIVPPETIQVFLHFTGATDDPVFETYLEYMQAHQETLPLWTIYIQGPYMLTRGGEEFRLPDEGDSAEIEQIWRDSAAFVLEMIRRAGHTRRHVAFFLYSPNPLPMILAADRKFKLPYDVYHHRQHERAIEKTYVRVFSVG